MNSKLKMKSISQKGITLIALVITIIVLLILAGVTITMVLGQDGIIGQAEKAAQKYEDAENNENKDVEKMKDQISYIEVEEEFNTKKTNGYNDGVEGAPEYSPYLFKNGYLTGLTVGDKVSECEEKLPEGYKIFDAEGKKIDKKEDLIIITGMVLKKENGETAEKKGTLIILGDTNCDGKINNNDYHPITYYAAGDDVEEYLKVAMDINTDGYINGNDSNLIREVAAELQVIDQNFIAKNADKIVLQGYKYALQEYAKKLVATNNLYRLEWDEGNLSYIITGQITAETTGKNIMDGIGMKEVDNPSLLTYDEDIEEYEQVSNDTLIQDGDIICFKEQTYNWGTINFAIINI